MYKRQFIDRSGIPPHEKVHDITRAQRERVRTLLKHWTVNVTAPMPVENAIVTSGGVKVNQVQPSTMESKLTPGLYFAGEILDVDAYTGGFNLQIAWSTGHAAGEGAVTFTARMRRGSELFAGLERLDFVKCDVEGYELIVMHELRPLLERFRPTVLIETGGENRPQIIELFTELDYKGYTLENGREIPLAPDTEKDIIFRQAR